jgi:hypothetical protein
LESVLNQAKEPEAAKKEPEPVPEHDWEEFENDADGRFYYHNSKTGATVWTKPDECKAAEEAEARNKALAEATPSLTLMAVGPWSSPLSASHAWCLKRIITIYEFAEPLKVAAANANLATYHRDCGKWAEVRFPSQALAHLSSRRHNGVFLRLWRPGLPRT